MHVMQVNYTVQTVTGNMTGAGTSANVFITLHGTVGESKRVQLNNSECPCLFWGGSPCTMILPSAGTKHTHTHILVDCMCVQTVKRTSNEDAQTHSSSGSWT
jgi:hypothetical protein